MTGDAPGGDPAARAAAVFRRGPGSVLVDFDGTVATVDVGNRLFHRITGGAWSAVVESWKSGLISSRQCLIHECAAARATGEEVRAFARAQPIAPEFAGFADWLAETGWRVRVVSDGLDVYIREILGREGLDALPVESNRVRFCGDRLLPSFPFAGRGCGRCGNCKAGSVADARRFGPVVFVGDGLSDRCGAETADFVFAREGKDLAGFCRERGIPHVVFDRFDVVRSCLESGRLEPAARNQRS